MSHLRTVHLLAAVLALGACGTSSSPAPTSSPVPTPTSTPTPAPQPAPTPAPPSGSGAAPSGNASTELLAIVRAAHARKARMVVTGTHPGSPGPGTRMTVEEVPPDSRHSIMEMSVGPRTTHVETIIIGEQGWMRMEEGPWRASPQTSVAVGAAGAASMTEQLLHDIEAGRVTVSEDPTSGGMRVFHVAVPVGVLPGGGTWDGRVFVGSNGLPDHVDGVSTGGPQGGATMHETFEYDDSITIAPPI